MKILNSFIYDNFYIITFFDDGRVTKYDFKEFMKNAPFEKLEDKEYFLSKFKFNFYKIYWDDEIDCPKDVLYDNGKNIGNLDLNT